MNFVQSPDDVSVKDSVVCIGNFDGVHIGHQMLLSAMQQEAQRLAKPGIILTFFPPAKLFFSGDDFLSTPEEKLELLLPYRPAAVVIIPFNKDYAETPSARFVAQLERLDPHTLIVGEDFRFGHNREGSLNDLSKVGQRLEVFNLKHIGEEPVSSSRVRSLLKEGNPELVSKLLGRCYTATGTVIAGDKRGRQIGFPTANVQTPKGKALPLGVFAVEVKVDGDTVEGMANVGPRPSFPSEPPSLEVHLFDFADDLYHQNITVSFKHFLRSQQKFAGIEALKAQLELDKRNAKALISS